MMRRTPFKRRTPVHAHNPIEREARRAASMAALLASPGRAAVMGGATSGQPVDKERASQSGPYMRRAKALGYCMRCGVQVKPLTGLLDFCHADAGKGQGIKTDVRLGWPGCRGCHEAVGRHLPKPVRRAVEGLLGVMTRAAVREAGTWPARLADWPGDDS